MVEGISYSSLHDHNGILQLGNKIVARGGPSVMIYKESDVDEGKERQIFPDSSIKFLLPIVDPNEEKKDEKSFLLAISSNGLAIFRLKKSFPIALFDITEDEIVDHGEITVIHMGIVQKRIGEVFRVRLKIPLAFRSESLRIMKIAIDYRNKQVFKKSLKIVEDFPCEGEQMKCCIDLSNNTFFVVYDDTVVKSNGSIFRAGETSQLKKRRICVIGRELWNGKVLMATENGSIRVVQIEEEQIDKSECGLLTLRLLTRGQCVPPYSTVRCREPTVIISTPTAVIVGTARGEIHYLDSHLQLSHKIETERGPIASLKVNQQNSNTLLVGYDNGSLERLYILYEPMESENKISFNKTENHVEMVKEECIPPKTTSIKNGTIVIVDGKTNAEFECTVCSAVVGLRKSRHAMIHCEEKRYKCTMCPHTTIVMTHMKEHMRKHRNIAMRSIDLKNGLLEALWKKWMYKCFPDLNTVLKPRQRKKTSTVLKCSLCSETTKIVADDQDLFDHIVNVHSEENVDYNDPDGVMLKFFPGVVKIEESLTNEKRI